MCAKHLSLAACTKGKNETTWSALPWCKCFSKKFEAWGLLFPDRALEAEYIYATKSHITKTCCGCKVSVTRLILSTIFIVFILDGVVLFASPKHFTHAFIWIAVIFMLLVPATGLILNLVTVISRGGICKHDFTRCLCQRNGWPYRFTFFTVWFCIIIPFALFEQVGPENGGNVLWQISSDFPTAFNKTTNISYGYGVFVDDIVQEGPSWFFVSIVWAIQKIVVVLDILPSRHFVIIVPFNAVLLWAFAIYLASQNVYNIGYNVTCVSPAIDFVVQVFFQLVIGILAASFALLWTIIRLDVGMREIFVCNADLLTKTQTLQQEADPFNPSSLRSWLTATKQIRTNSASSKKLRVNTHDQKSIIGISTHQEISQKNICPERHGEPLHGVENDPTFNRNGEKNFWMIPCSEISVKNRIAAGSGGCVFHGMYQKSTPVALKQIYSTRMCEVDDLAHETSLLAQLAHVHIVKFLGLCKMPSMEPDCIPMVYMVQEWCSLNLRAYISEPIDNDNIHRKNWMTEVVRLAKEICSGMAYLHSRNIVHRDLKPENILLSGRDKIVRLADFGISSQQANQYTSSLSTKHILTAAAGTIFYMAPETYVHLLKHSKEACNAIPAVDIYAFGVILWELLYQGVCAAPKLACLHQYDENLLESPPCSLSSLRDIWEWPVVGKTVYAESPQYLIRILHCCWLFDSDQRPTFKQLQQLLENEKSHDCLPKIRHSVSDPTLRKQRTSNSPDSGMSNLKMPLLNDFSSDGIQSRTSHDSNSISSHHENDILLKSMAQTFKRKGLRFQRADVERKFNDYMHSNDFYKMLRWAYICVAILYLLSILVNFGFMLHIHDNTENSMGPYYNNMTWLQWPLSELGGALQFICVSVFAWVPQWRKCANKYVLIVSVLRAILASLSTLRYNFHGGISYYFVNLFNNSRDAWWICDSFDDMTFINHSAGLDTTLCLQSMISVNGNENFSLTCNAITYGFGVQGTLFTLAAYGTFFFEALTMPVIYMIVGLPLRLYLWAILLPFITFILKWCLFIHDSGQDSIINIALLVLGVCVYVSCVLSAMRGEKLRRSLFTMYCELVSQKKMLSQDVMFRSYRDVLAANRDYFIITSSNEDQRHLEAKAVTIN